MIVDGGGLIATAFRTSGDPGVPGIVFARGVANSSCTDERQYARELESLRATIAIGEQMGEVVVYFTGAPIYGSFKEPASEATPVRPSTRYGWHQAECERLLVDGGAPYLALRLPNLVGPTGNPHQLIPSIVRQVIGGHVRVETRAERDLLDVDDLVQIVHGLLSTGVANIAVNVASGVSIAVETIADEVARSLGRSPIYDRFDLGQDQRFDITRLRGLLDAPTFGASYPLAVLRRRVPEIARAWLGT